MEAMGIGTSEWREYSTEESLASMMSTELDLSLRSRTSFAGSRTAFGGVRMTFAEACMARIARNRPATARSDMDSRLELNAMDYLSSSRRKMANYHMSITPPPHPSLPFPFFF